jgi:hypothetical protein
MNTNAAIEEFFDMFRRGPITRTTVLPNAISNLLLYFMQTEFAVLMFPTLNMFMNISVSVTRATRVMKGVSSFGPMGHLYDLYAPVLHLWFPAVRRGFILASTFYPDLYVSCLLLLTCIPGLKERDMKVGFSTM